MKEREKKCTEETEWGRQGGRRWRGEESNRERESGRFSCASTAMSGWWRGGRVVRG